MTESPVDMDSMNGAQLAVMDSLWRANREFKLPADEIRAIETLIQAGKVHGARKRITAARKAARERQ